jgi:putative ABC transport system ATP-binding protein
MSNETALSATDLRKSFSMGEETVEVIKDLTFSLPQGAFEAVMGPSGSGKSTILHLLAGLLAPDSGTITIGGQDIGHMTDHDLTVFRRRRIGLIFQDFNLIPTLTAEENVALPLLLDKSEKEHRARVDELIEALGLSKRRRHLPAKLSGGERQRVAIARALAGDPAVVLADEPTGNLDSPAARDFCALLRELNKAKGYSILMVSHDPVVAAAAQRVHILRDGKFLDAFDTGNDPALVSEHYLAAMR